ncbi:MAG TPA: YceI family protein [bacterium]|nr:YceI family protein [bacterium]HPN42536.1 YceI family protein [bacterium]
MKKTVLLVCLLFTSVALSADYQVNKDRENQVIFNSDAPGAKIQGITDAIDGYVSWNDQNPLAQSELYFEVDLNTLDTGNKIRNRQMWESFLETDKYRYAFFRGVIQALDTLITDRSYRVTINGMLNVHGVERPYKIEGIVNKESDALQVESFFELVLPEHKITVPRILFIKLSPILQIEITLFLKPQSQ